MVERADVLVAYCHKTTGGAAYTVKCFQKAHPDGQIVFIWEKNPLHLSTIPLDDILFKYNNSSSISRVLWKSGQVVFSPDFRMKSKGFFKAWKRVDNSRFLCGEKCGKKVDLWKYKKYFPKKKCIKIKNICIKMKNNGLSTKVINKWITL